MSTLTIYERLAALFDYPDADYLTHVAEARNELADDFPTAALHLDRFVQVLPGDGKRLDALEVDEIQEVFTRSFDVQSITTLGVGYVMFGDDYKRGELLVNLNRELDDAGIPCGTELPDHLPTVLRLLGCWEDRELVREFADEIMHPALRMMIEEFGVDRIALRNRLYEKHFKTLIASSETRSTMFCEPLAAVLSVLEQDFSLVPKIPAEKENDFLGFVGRELDIEMTEGKAIEARTKS
jgi:nitrate reductase assembly molybdenum cofactor insertion protein NarJ